MDTSETTQLRGATVVDRDGDKIGSIDDIYVDHQTGRPEWVAVRTGMLSTRLTFVPLAAARRSGEELQVAYEKALVKDAPGIDADGRLSEHEEARLYAHYGLEHGHDVSGPTTDDAMTRSEEELRVGTRDREAGRLRLRKWVETEPVQTTVQTRREKARVEREPITEANVDAALDGPEISEEEHEVVLYEEEPVVEKRVVPKERVRLSKDAVLDETEVSDQVRKERIETDGDAERRHS